MSVSRLRDLLIRHEGLRLKAYVCSEGKTTIGVGRNLDDVGLTEFEARFLLTNDIERVMKETAEFSWFKSISVPRQDVVISMIFNMGLARFKGFKKMIDAMVRGDFKAASAEMLDSKWATQVGARAQELAIMMRLGRY